MAPFNLHPVNCTRQAARGSYVLLNALVISRTRQGGTDKLRLSVVRPYVQTGPHLPWGF